MKDKNITINGITFTPEMLEELKRWELEDENDSEPMYFIEFLTEIQDYFCTALSNVDAEDIEGYQKIAGLMSKVLNIKAAFKPFTKLKS